MEQSTQPAVDPKVVQDIEDNKVIAAIAYLGILCLIPLLLKRDSAYAQFHGKQGLILVIGWVALHLIGVIPIFGWLLYPIGLAVLVVLSLLGIIKSLSGEQWDMPYLGEYAKKLKI